MRTLNAWEILPVTFYRLNAINKFAHHSIVTIYIILIHVYNFLVGQSPLYMQNKKNTMLAAYCRRGGLNLFRRMIHTCTIFTQKIIYISRETSVLSFSPI